MCFHQSCTNGWLWSGDNSVWNNMEWQRQTWQWRSWVTNDMIVLMITHSSNWTTRQRLKYYIGLMAWWNIDIVSGLRYNTMCLSQLSRSWGTGSEKNLVAQRVYRLWDYMVQGRTNIGQIVSPTIAKWEIWFKGNHGDFMDPIHIKVCNTLKGI